MSEQNNNLSGIEKIKQASDGLRGEITSSLKDEITGAIREGDQALIKFHGMYQQDDRDRREERAEKKLDRLYTFMIRLRLPGGYLNAAQWVAMHHIAGKNSTGVIKITTRQTIQLHGLVKSHIKPTIHSFSEALLDSIATCGDINRNVLCSAHPKQSPLHEEVFAYADDISRMLMPKTKAYYEIWLDDSKIADKKEEEDPLYQDRYLPRKFKIAIAIPPNNDVDVLTNDLGLIAVIENNELKGFNIAIGGGMSTTHGNPATYARLGTVIGFVEKGEATMKAVYEVVTIQRDYGNRSDRKLARLKYTVDKVGASWYKEEIERRAGITIHPIRAYTFTERRDYYGWLPNDKGQWYYTVYVENGRVTDDKQQQVKTALLEVAMLGKCTFRFTANQNVIISDVDAADKDLINSILQKYNIIQYTEQTSLVRKNSIACVALPTCPLALAEGQRYMPVLIGKIEPLLAKHGLAEDDIIMRMTGCPNGCARPGAAEIAFVGTAPGHYNLQLGGDRIGTRLNKIYKEHLDEAAILSELDSLFAQYSSERTNSETFGDFTWRKFMQ
ncbi:MAG TPA: NADPH-dependent assimilatory sulfite reductase hemoprotein subunit [Chitinophagaceae bacterium]|nr:NADPH-dependent assimilatory sulfite reductase hemoprotein subunit [Chitinophagaceae bacterium]